MKVPKTTTNCGTPAYVAPEVLIGHGHSFEVDIWSLGVLLMEIVSGQTPFTGESTHAVYEKINKCKPSYNRMITPVMRDLLDQIFVYDPEIRIKIDKIKVHPLFKVSYNLFTIFTGFWLGPLYEWYLSNGSSLYSIISNFQWISWPLFCCEGEEIRSSWHFCCQRWHWLEKAVIRREALWKVFARRWQHKYSKEEAPKSPWWLQI